VMSPGKAVCTELEIDVLAKGDEVKLQIALDFLKLEDALEITREVVDYIDIVEVGTPLILREGLEAVREAKKNFPQKTILADLKIADAGAEEATMAFEAGADIVTVLALASDNTIRFAVESARKANKQVLADLIAVKDVYSRAQELRKMGVDYVCLHTAFDDRVAAERSYQELAELKKIPDIQVGVAGGINQAALKQILSAKPDLVIVGRALTAASNRRELAKTFKENLESDITFPISSRGDGLGDLSSIAGLDVRFDTKSNRLVFGPDVLQIEPTVRYLRDMRDVLLDSDARKPLEVYYAYRGVCRKQDKELLEKSGLRYDLVVVPPGRIGREYAKTAGHGHEIVAGSCRTYPEIYFVLAGTAHYLLQRIRWSNEWSNEKAKPEVEDAYCVIAGPGDVVFIPPDYEHVTINTGGETLIVGNWVGTNFKSVYERLERNRGACYYLINEAGKIKVLPNRNYSLTGELSFRKPQYYLSTGFTKGEPAYQTVTSAPEKFGYLCGEGQYLRVLSHWERLGAFRDREDEERIGQLFEAIIGEVSQVASGFFPDQYLSFIKFLLGAERIFLTGQGRSGLVARAFAMRLMHLDFKTYVVGESTTPSIGRGDVLIACSGSGATPITLSLAKSARRAGATLIVLGCREDSPLSRIADLPIQLPAAGKNERSRKAMTIQLPGTLFEQVLLLYFDACVVTLRRTLELGDREMMSRHANLE